MQTFLPSNSYTECARILDNRRLGKQRVECKQILLALQDPSYGWQNHPAVKMWYGYEYSLCEYAIAICREWYFTRKFNDTLLDFFMLEKILMKNPITKNKPEWLTDDLIRSHQSNLLRKAPGYYMQFGWNVPDNLEYVWPVR